MVSAPPKSLFKFRIQQWINQVGQSPPSLITSGNALKNTPRGVLYESPRNFSTQQIDNQNFYHTPQHPLLLSFPGTIHDCFVPSDTKHCFFLGISSEQINTNLKRLIWPDVVAHTCNPSYSGGTD
jgi:hypothetical protein